MKDQGKVKKITGKDRWKIYKRSMNGPVKIMKDWSQARSMTGFVVFWKPSVVSAWDSWWDWDQTNLETGVS